MAGDLWKTLPHGYRTTLRIEKWLYDDNHTPLAMLAFAGYCAWRRRLVSVAIASADLSEPRHRAPGSASVSLATYVRRRVLSIFNSRMNLARPNAIVLLSPGSAEGDRCIRCILREVVSWKGRLSRIPPKRQGVQRWRSHAMRQRSDIGGGDPAIGGQRHGAAAVLRAGTAVRTPPALVAAKVAGRSRPTRRPPAPGVVGGFVTAAIGKTTLLSFPSAFPSPSGADRSRSSARARHSCSGDLRHGRLRPNFGGDRRSGGYVGEQ